MPFPPARLRQWKARHRVSPRPDSFLAHMLIQKRAAKNGAPENGAPDHRKLESVSPEEEAEGGVPEAEVPEEKAPTPAPGDGDDGSGEKGNNTKVCRDQFKVRFKELINELMYFQRV